MADDVVERRGVTRVEVVILVTLALALAAVVWWGAAREAGVASRMSAAQARIDSAQTEQTSAESAASTMWSGVMSDATGAKTDREAADEGTIQAAMRVAFTWSDSTSYANARTTLMERYGMASDCQFLTRYMPALTEMTKADGTGTFDEVEASGASMSFSSADVHVESVDGDAYTYVAFVSVSASTTSSTAGSGIVVVEWTSDGAGGVTASGVSLSTM